MEELIKILDDSYILVYKGTIVYSVVCFEGGTATLK